jgi:hypothetical protein
MKFTFPLSPVKAILSPWTLMCEFHLFSAADEPESDDSDSEESLIFQRGNNAKGTASLLKGPSSGASTSTSTASNGKSHGSNGILKKPRPGIKA